MANKRGSSKRLTAEQFELLRPLMLSMSDDRIENAYQVLVLGRGLQEVATERGIERQLVNAALLSVWNIWERMGDGRWVPVNCYAPAELARDFIKAVEDSRKTLELKAKKKSPGPAAPGLKVNVTQTSPTDRGNES